MIDSCVQAWAAVTTACISPPMQVFSSTRKSYSAAHSPSLPATASDRSGAVSSAEISASEDPAVIRRAMRAMKGLQLAVRDDDD
jgi:hypothetical protein